MDDARLSRDGVYIDVTRHDSPSHHHRPGPWLLHGFVVFVWTYANEKSPRRYGNGHVAIDHEGRATKHLDLSDRSNALEGVPDQREFGTVGAHAVASMRSMESRRSRAPSQPTAWRSAAPG